ncbi:SDR family oxidoreductase [Vibrio parahaemolyticus]|nr:SDR family oxidoreductase [Vibrio parahaemolyticus]
MIIDLFGANSKIIKELSLMLDKSDKIKKVNKFDRNKLDFSNITQEQLKSAINLSSDYYIISVGVLYPKRILEQSEEEINLSINVNLLSIVKICDYLLENNDKAKIIIVGSESGKKGSYDTTYFLTKAALSAYVKERKITSENQQIVIVSPSVIQDAKMTTSREDHDNININRDAHPKKRLLNSVEVANVIFFLIESGLDYITNTEIEVNGGKFARMKY